MIREDYGYIVKYLLDSLLKGKKLPTKYGLAKQLNIPQSSLLKYLKRLRKNNIVDFKITSTEKGLVRHHVSLTLYGLIKAVEYGWIGLDEGAECLVKALRLEEFYRALAPPGIDTVKVAKAVAKIFLKEPPQLRSFVRECLRNSIDVLEELNCISILRKLVYFNAVLYFFKAFEKKIEALLLGSALGFRVVILTDPKSIIKALTNDESEAEEYIKFLKNTDIMYFVLLNLVSIMRVLHERDLVIELKKSLSKVYEVEEDNLKPLVKESGEEKRVIEISW